MYFTDQMKNALEITKTLIYCQVTLEELIPAKFELLNKNEIKMLTVQIEQPSHVRLTILASFRHPLNI